MLTLGTKDLSTYRTPLMGMATLMIIACHAPASGVVLPQVLSRLLTMGNYGVDLFLLLSGIGVYYSLSKQSATSLGGGTLVQEEIKQNNYSLSDCLHTLQHRYAAAG